MVAEDFDARVAGACGEASWLGVHSESGYAGLLRGGWWGYGADKVAHSSAAVNCQC